MKNKGKLEQILLIFGLACIPVLVLLCILWGVNNYRYYSDIKDNAVVVSAVVTEHKEFSSIDEGIEKYSYSSYITYTVGGKTFENIRYQTVKAKSKLLPVGSEINIEIDPNNPSVLLRDLKNNSVGSLFFGLLICSLCFFSYSWKNNKRRK